MKNTKAKRKCKTLKNKVFGTLMILLGIVPIILERDGTALVFTGSIGLWLIFAKENCMDI